MKEPIKALPSYVITLRWIARIMGTTLVSFFLLFFVAELFRDGGVPNLHNPYQIIAFTSFFIAQIGILLAWRWEGMGGFLALTGMVLFVVFQYLWDKNPKIVFMFLIWIIPIIMFLYYWIRSKKLDQIRNDMNQS